MKKLLYLFIFLFVFGFICDSFAQTSMYSGVSPYQVSPGQSNGEINFIINPDARKNALGCTESGSASCDRDVLNALDGEAVFSCNTSAQNEYCEWSLKTITEPAASSAATCVFSGWYKDSNAAHRFQITDGSGNELAGLDSVDTTDPVAGSPVYRQFSVTYQCGVSRKVRLKQIDAGDPGAFFLGKLQYSLWNGFGSSVETFYAKATQTSSVGTGSNFAATSLSFVEGDSSAFTTSGLVVPWTGEFVAEEYVSYASNATGVRACDIYINGVAARLEIINAVASTATTVSCATNRIFNAGDVVTCGGLQNSGGSLSQTCTIVLRGVRPVNTLSMNVDPIVVSVYKATSQTGINMNNSDVKLVFDTPKQGTTLKYWDTSNNRFIPGFPGLYQCGGSVYINATNVSGTLYRPLIVKNGSTNVSLSEFNPSVTASQAFLKTAFTPYFYMDHDDYVEFYLYSSANHSSNTISTQATESVTWFSCWSLGAHSKVANVAGGVTTSSAVKTQAVDGFTSVDYGTYTPTLTGTANVDSITASGAWTWVRTGSVVTVSGFASIDPTASSASTTATVSLPVLRSTNFGSDGCGGVFHAGAVNAGGYISAVNGTLNCGISFQSVNTGGVSYGFHFTYRLD